MFFDCCFSEAILNTDYKGIRDISFVYDVFLEHNGLHWFLMVRSQEGKFLPYIVFEITTNSVDEGEIIPVMRVVRDPFGNSCLSKAHIAYLRKSTSSSFERVRRWLGRSNDERTTAEVTLQFAGFMAQQIGSKKTTMGVLCDIADSKKAEMARKKYNLRTNNCQHFCNKFLTELGMEEVQTTIGTRVKTDKFDEFTTIFLTPTETIQINTDEVEEGEGGV